MGKIFDDYVKKCQGFWSSNYSTFSQLTNPSHLNQKAPYPGFEVAVFNDRGKGGTHGSNVYEKENGLLIVGCNPSGIAKHHNYRKPVPCYENPDCKNFYIINTYPLANDPYTYAIEDFAKKCGYGQNYYKMDFIGIMRKEQRVLEDDMNNGLHNTLYAKLFEIFVDTVIALKPEKIVIVNAFISNLICDRKKKYKNIINGHVSIGPNRNQKGGLPVSFSINGKVFDSTIWFSSMLSGQRALDNGNKGLLIWAVHK